MELKSLSLTLTGDLDFRVFKSYRQIRDRKYHAILIVQFCGDHGYGSGGNRNSDFMRTIVAASIGLYLCNGLILDLREITYEFGDSLLSVLGLPLKLRGNGFPYRILISDKCDKGIESLLEFGQVQEQYQTCRDLELCIEEIYGLLNSA